jgi:hypothetical protein
MDAQATLSALRARGASITLEAEGIRIMPTRVLTPQMRAAIKDNKAEILGILQEVDTPAKFRETPGNEPAPGERSMLARDVYNPALAVVKAKRLHAAGKATAAQRDALIRYALNEPIPRELTANGSRDFINSVEATA